MFNPPVSALVGRGGCFLPTEALAAPPPGPPSPGNASQNLSISSLQGKLPFLCAFQEEEGYSLETRSQKHTLFQVRWVDLLRIRAGVGGSVRTCSLHPRVRARAARAASWALGVHAWRGARPRVTARLGSPGWCWHRWGTWGPPP